MGILAVWSTTTGIWVSRWVESWAGHVIEPGDKSSPPEADSHKAHGRAGFAPIS